MSPATTAVAPATTSVARESWLGGDWTAQPDGTLTRPLYARQISLIRPTARDHGWRYAVDGMVSTRRYPSAFQAAQAAWSSIHWDPCRARTRFSNQQRGQHPWLSSTPAAGR